MFLKSAGASAIFAGRACRQGAKSIYRNLRVGTATVLTVASFTAGGIETKHIKLFFLTNRA